MCNFWLATPKMNRWFLNYDGNWDWDAIAKQSDCKV